MLSFIKRILSKHPEGFEIEVAMTGKKGMKKFTKSKFVCLLLDHRLLDTNALELLKEVRKSHLHTPVIILTGLKDERFLNWNIKTWGSQFPGKRPASG